VKFQICDLLFFSLENVVLTPHIAVMTDLALINMAIDSAEGIIDVLEGRVPKYLMNADVLRNARIV
jgi:lactate dehydrogenase-like 2-hydroxyacid dehydrogenase